MTSALMSSQSAEEVEHKLKRRRVLNQQMKQSMREEATSYGDSADGLVGDDVIGDVIQSQDSAGITDSACKNQLVVVSVQYGPFNTYIPIRSTTIGISRVAIDPITMHTSWRSNSDIASVTRQTHLPKTHPVLRPEIYHTIISSDSIGYPRMKASGESSTTKHRLLHSWGPYPIPPPNDPKQNSRRIATGIAGWRPQGGAHRATGVRQLQCRHVAATVPACGGYSACVRRIQCRRAAASVPSCFFFCFLILKNSKSDAIRHNYVLKDTSLGSKTTVGDNGGSVSRGTAKAALETPQSGPRPEAGFLRQPALEGLTNLARTESPLQGDRNKSDHEATAAARRQGAAAVGGVEEKGAAQGMEARVGVSKEYLAGTCAWLQPELQERRLFTVGGGRSVNQVHDRNRYPSNQHALEG
ncbi:hypothetical protein F511_23128 [Dorcoceras hygrometricum]|uniref:Uncharacterized protein n=1 Tax=Dorcoceras hygrometricum TaxID=472368 RepID=A0A2Z7C6Q5_9LAMI|nr:hypothetical protein F511_23128 [Dorcoceras hygrometricum]